MTHYTSGRTVPFLGIPNSSDILPYFAGLLKCSRILEKPIHSALLNTVPAFSFGRFRFEFLLTLFFFDFGFPLNAPFERTLSIFAILASFLRLSFERAIRKDA